MGRGCWEGGKTARHGGQPLSEQMEQQSHRVRDSWSERGDAAAELQEGSHPRQGQTPLSSPKNTAGGEFTQTQRVQRTTRQATNVRGLREEATKPVARIWAKITGQVRGPHTRAACHHRFSLESNHIPP